MRPVALITGASPRCRGKPRRIQRGRHDEDAQILPQAPLHIKRERQPQVAIQRALVELVEDDQPRVRPVQDRSAGAG